MKSRISIYADLAFYIFISVTCLCQMPSHSIDQPLISNRGLIDP
jgi:hypothetical protein